MEWIVLGNAPQKENIPVTPRDQDSPAREIAEIFARQLVRHFGPPPVGVRITVERIRDRVCTLYCAVCRYDASDDAAFEYAWRCSENAPHHWDEIARRELAGVEGAT
jgi:hypothetical protein